MTTRPGSRPGRLEASSTLESYQRRLAVRINRMMALLLVAEWIGAVALAYLFSPLTYQGAAAKTHPHLVAALLFGPALVAAPVWLSLRHSGSVFTRHAIAVAQMMMSALLIDVTNGRIETHFHIFGSLAFLAFYRDWRVLITASLVTGLDHLIRGIYLPWTIYGVFTASPWRWLEHAWWVGFEDFFLIVSFRQVQRELLTVAKREVRLAYGAHHDVLTGLPNRRLLQERFAASSGRTQTRRAVFFLDLDRFKHVNDSLGHTVGDKLLALVGRRLSALFGVEDTVARVGGDEFVILTEYGSDEAVKATAGRILDIFIEPFEVDEHRLLLSASIGVSLAPDHGSSISELQSSADIAMYEAKARGRERWAVYSPAMLEKQRRNQKIEQDLSLAMAKGEIEAYYQPLLNSREETVGFEALMRWKHPRLGYVSPSDFIPLAEKTGLIVEMGEWILRHACDQAVRWRGGKASGPGVSVNVSAVQFDHPGFVQTVEDAIRASGIDPRALTLELTETSLMRNIALAGQNLTRLRSLGVQIALDDFGTGYSSLQYLQSLPADSIKLDNAFIARATAGNARMLRSLVELAHGNGLRVTAEGVETQEQSRMLRSMGCDCLQGYFYGKPMDVAAAEQYLQVHRNAPSPEAELVLQ